MDTREKNIENLKDYKYGFSTDIENIRAPKGLNEDVIKFISNIKKEPKWMLDFRLKAFERFKQLKEPNWQKPKYPKIDYQDLYYYSAPKSVKDAPKSLNEVDRYKLHIELEEDLPALILDISEADQRLWLSRWRDQNDPLFHPDSFREIPKAPGRFGFCHGGDSSRRSRSQDDSHSGSRETSAWQGSLPRVNRGRLARQVRSPRCLAPAFGRCLGRDSRR